MASTVQSQLKSYLRGLAKRRTNKLVTADDVQNFMNRKGFWVSQNNTLSITRRVLNEKNFVNTGNQVPSKREAARSRRVTAWTL